MRHIRPRTQQGYKGRECFCGRLKWAETHSKDEPGESLWQRTCMKAAYDWPNVTRSVVCTWARNDLGTWRPSFVQIVCHTVWYVLRVVNLLESKTIMFTYFLWNEWKILLNFSLEKKLFQTLNSNFVIATVRCLVFASFNWETISSSQFRIGFEVSHAD